MALLCLNFFSNEILFFFFFFLIFFSLCCNFLVLFFFLGFWCSSYFTVLMCFKVLLSQPLLLNCQTHVSFSPQLKVLDPDTLVLFFAVYPTLLPHDYNEVLFQIQNFVNLLGSWDLKKKQKRMFFDSFL